MLAASCISTLVVNAVFSALGILLALLVARHRPTDTTLVAAASSAAAIAHTVPVVPQPKRQPQAQSTAL